MNTARDRLAAQLKSASPGEKKPSTPAAPAPGVETRPTARTKRVRRTLDLSPAQHHELKTWATEMAFVFGVAEVPGQHVLEEMVGLFLTDVRMQDMVAARLRKRYEEE